MLADARLHAAEPRDPALDAIAALLVATTGNVRLAERPAPVAEKVRQRLRARALASPEAYLALLESAAGRQEFDWLVSELTVGETSFFRHGEHFETLRDHVLPACLERNARTRQLRIWSAGCANGAEAYSIAITVDSLLGHRLSDWNVSIIGSDINSALLEKAERGLFSKWMFRNVAKEHMPGFVRRQGDGWSVAEKYRRNVKFVKHNLVAEQVPSLEKNLFAFDIVFCRNVMIYFDAATNRMLAERLADALVGDGYLFVAPADFHGHLPHIFETARLGGTTVLRRKAPAPKVLPGPASPVASARPAAPARSPRPDDRPLRAPPARRSPKRGAAPPPSPRPVATRQAAAADRIATLVELANRGEWTGAARCCRAMLDADPCNAAAYYYLGLVLYSTGAPVEAERAWRRAVYLDRDFALVHYQLGLARKDVEDVSGSCRAFSNALQALRDSPDDRPVSPCRQVTAGELREMTTRQLRLMAEP